MTKSRRIKKIAVDLVPIEAGKGGTGGGVWRHLISTLKALDQLSLEDHEVICLLNSNSSIEFTHIKTLKFSISARGFVGRMIWMHFVLPIWCFFRRIDILHRPTAERPILISSNVVSTVHDFMSEYYFENRTSRGSVVDILKHLYFSFMTRFSLNHSSACLFPTCTISDEAIRRYGKSFTPHIILQGGVDEKDIITLEALQRDRSSSECITVVAAFHPHKGHVQALRAFETLIANYYSSSSKKPHLVFRGHIGDKEYWSMILDMINESPCRHLVDVVPYEEGANIRKIYEDVSIVMSLSRYEGLGLPLLEAQMMGIPVVCSDIAVFRETLADSVLRVSADNPDEVARTCYAIQVDVSLRSQLIKNGLENCRRYLWQNAASACIEAYRRAMILGSD